MSILQNIFLLTGICIFLKINTQARVKYLESSEYKKNTNPKKDERVKKFTRLANCLFYISIALIVLYLICPILVAEIMVKPVTNLTLSIGVMIWSAFIIFNSESMGHNRYGSADYKIPDHLIDENKKFGYLLVYSGFGIFLLASIFTIRTIISIFKL